MGAVWRATLDDGRKVVVKVGPPRSARLLEYEKGVVPAEAEYCDMVRRHVPGVPVPTVLAVWNVPLPPLDGVVERYRRRAGLGEPAGASERRSP